MDLAALKQDVMSGVVQVKHSTGSKQIADVLSKSGANPDLIRKVLSTGSLEGVLESLN